MSGTKCRCYIDLFAAHSEVTGSNFLLVIKLPDGKQVKGVVDCGVFQEKEWESNNTKLLFDPKTVDFVLVTHAHADHVGRLPLLVKEGYSGKIFCTEDTARILPNALFDSCKVLDTKYKRNNMASIYESQHVSQTLTMLEPKSMNDPFMVHENVRVTMLSNGHIQGACMLLVQIMDYEEEYINLLFTGDYNNKNIFFDVLPIPQWVRNLPITIITESTYGDTDMPAEKCFEKNVFEATQKGSSVLIPAFSLGRVQEVLYMLKCMQDSGKLSTKITVHLDGTLAVKYTQLYKSGALNVSPEMKEFLPANFQFVGKVNREEYASRGGQKIIVTTSGMGTYGPAQTYIPYYLGRERALIHFTGYCAEGTYGRKLKDAKENEFIVSGDGGGILALKRAKVEFTSEFSAHAKAGTLIKLLKKFKNAKSILINHGETQTKLGFAKRVYSEVECKKVAIIDRKEGFRIGEYGIVKPLNTDLK